MHNAPSLLELQQRFVDGVLHGQDAPVSSWVLGQGLLPESRLQIYRNLVVNNHNAALRTMYPAVLKLVGEEFFDSAASCYLRNFSFDSGNLQDYGAAFPECLARMAEISDFAYLPDVARLEWARQKAYLAADADPVSSAGLADIPEEDWNVLEFVLHPSVQRVQSSYPILDIWLYCQQDTPEDLLLSAEGQQVMVWRDEPQVAQCALDAGRAKFIDALLKQTPLEVANLLTRNQHPEFDLQACLQWLFAMRLIMCFAMADG